MLTRILAVVTLALTVAACTPIEEADAPATAAEPAAPIVDYYVSEGTAAAGYPFADAVQVGNMLFLSGQIGVQPETFQLVEGGIETETRRTLDNIGRILAARGSSFEEIVKCTVMLADIVEWPAFNGIYKEYFPSGRYPARSAFAASGLALGARVEVECWATVK